MRTTVRLATSVLVVAVSHGVAAAQQQPPPGSQSEACAALLPPPGSWTTQEGWVWDQACRGEDADLSGLAPPGVEFHDDCPEVHELRPEFLRAILLSEPHRKALAPRLYVRCALITGPLDLSDLRLELRLRFEASRFLDDVLLNALHSTNGLSFIGSRLDGNLYATQVDLGGSLFLRNAQLGGELYLTGGHIGGDLEMDGAVVVGALVADRLEVMGSIHMRGPARFADVELVGASVSGDLAIGAGPFPPYAGSTFGGTLDADGVEIGGHLLMSGGTFRDVELAFGGIGGHIGLDDTDVDGVVDLSGTRVGRELRLASPRSKPPRWSCDARLILRNVHTAALNDTAESWPQGPGSLDLAGFRYDQFGGLEAAGDDTMADRTVAWLRGWLARQEGFEASYDPQPFEQLSQTLRASGRPDKADDVMVLARNHLRDSPTTPFLSWLLLWIEFWVIGYGYENGRALFWFMALVFVGTGSLMISPAGRGLRHWDRFWFSFDRAVPVLALRSRYVDMSLQGGTAVYFYCHTIAGFLLVGFLVAGLSGLTK